MVNDVFLQYYLNQSDFHGKPSEKRWDHPAHIRKEEAKDVKIGFLLKISIFR